MKTGRNELCPCGSGKKYKKCCMNKAKEDKFVHPITGEEMVLVEKDVQLDNVPDDYVILRERDRARKVIMDEIELVRDKQKDLPKDICDKCGKLEVIHEYQEGFGFMEGMPKRKLCFACMEFRDSYLLEQK